MVDYFAKNYLKPSENFQKLYSPRHAGALYTCITVSFRYKCKHISILMPRVPSPLRFQSHTDLVLIMFAQRKVTELFCVRTKISCSCLGAWSSTSVTHVWTAYCPHEPRRSALLAVHNGAACNTDMLVLRLARSNPNPKYSIGAVIANTHADTLFSHRPVTNQLKRVKYSAVWFTRDQRARIIRYRRRMCS